MELECDLCKRIESEPYDIGDSCYCGGSFNINEPQLNKIYHDDFTASFLYKLKDSSVDLFVLDPPYEIDYENGKDYSDCPGIVDLETVSTECKRVLKDTGNLLIFAGWTRFEYVNSFFKDWIFNNRIVWDRQKYKGAKYNFSNSAEDILWYSKAGPKIRTFNKIESNIKKVTKGFGTKNGRENRVLTNVWSDIPPIFPGKKEHLAGEKYKGQKPVAIMERLIKVFSNPGDIVCDGYCGSGSIVPASINTDRNFIVCDINERAVNITKNRIVEGI